MPSAIVTWRISTRGRHPTGGRSPVSPAGGSAPTREPEHDRGVRVGGEDRPLDAGRRDHGRRSRRLRSRRRRRGQALIERAIPQLEADPELVAYLRSALLFIFSWLDDWKAYAAIARVMQRAETAAVRTFGFVAIAPSTAPLDGGRGRRPAGPRWRMNYARQGPSIRASTSPWWADGCPTSGVGRCLPGEYAARPITPRSASPSTVGTTTSRW